MQHKQEEVPTPPPREDVPNLEERLGRNGVTPPPEPEGPPPKGVVREMLIGDLCHPDHPDKPGCDQEVGAASDACYDECVPGCQDEAACPCFEGCIMSMIPGHLPPEV